MTEPRARAKAIQGFLENDRKRADKATFSYFNFQALEVHCMPDPSGRARGLGPETAMLCYCKDDLVDILLYQSLGRNLYHLHSSKSPGHKPHRYRVFTLRTWCKAQQSYGHTRATFYTHFPLEERQKHTWRTSCDLMKPKTLSQA